MGKHADAEAFSRELTSLKRDGCNVLVVSDAAGRDAACERLLGAPELDRRHVFLTTSSDVNTILDRHAPRRTDPNSVGVVDATPGSYTRSATATAPNTDASADGLTDAPTDASAGRPTDASPDAPGDTLADAPTDATWYERIDDLTDLEALLVATRDALDRVAGDVDTPGAVRFCLDSFDPLFDAAARGDIDQEELFRFLHALASSVRGVDGMGHVHVSADIDDSRLATLEPLFDATIRVETDETGTISQRWHLHDSDYVSDWFEL